ncbi:MAG: DNA-3-methyladenine glycosylase I [bacterium]|jgi:DNA-3-methyladenine glycosylase I
MNHSRQRCAWCLKDNSYIQYHDREWGVPVHQDRKLFEFLILETFQAGLSWLTILRKRQNFRNAFDHFDFTTIARYDDRKIASLLEDPGIVRNRLKIAAAIANARAFIAVREQFGTFNNYIWRFTDGGTIHNHFNSLDEIPARTDLSDTIRKDLKQKGFKFVGSTVVYAHMQATGMVNDHLTDCFRHQELLQKFG